MPNNQTSGRKRAVKFATVAVPVADHKRYRQLADRRGQLIYRLIRDAIDALESSGGLLHKVNDAPDAQ